MSLISERIYSDIFMAIGFEEVAGRAWYGITDVSACRLWLYSVQKVFTSFLPTLVDIAKSKASW
jgi:hypothetical protein